MLNPEVPHSLQRRPASDHKRAQRVRRSEQPGTSREGAPVNGQVIMERRLVGSGVEESSSLSQEDHCKVGHAYVEFIDIFKKLQDFPCQLHCLVIVVFWVISLLLCSKLENSCVANNHTFDFL